MKKIFVIAALAAMFTLTSCGCGQTKSGDAIDSTAVETVDSVAVDSVQVAGSTAVETVAE